MRRGVCALAGLGIAVLVLALGPSVAAAKQESFTYRYGPIEIGPYGVNLREAVYDLPKPHVDGYVTGGDMNLVNADGSPVPIQRVMLHHVVVANLGTRVGERKDGTCDRFSMLDAESQNPAYAERFFGVGEERVVGDLPEGYGYPVKGADRWGATWMLMNHQGKKDSVYLQYTVRMETERKLTPAYPYWLDVRNCQFDPIFDVPGGGRRGSTHTERTTWTAPQPGRVVAALGHLHGGGKDTRLSQPDCGNRVLLHSRPTWARRKDPEYTIKPLVHEPGPINMELVTSKQGFQVAGGQKLELAADYDAERPHTRVMGIMMIYFSPDPGVKDKCAPPPGDVQVKRGTRPGRRKTPRLRVPINGGRPSGGVGPIDKPFGGRQWLSGSPVDTGDTFFEPANAVVRQGQRVRWRFSSETLHTVTLADGPRGFASPNLSEGREFSYRFRKPGTYKLYCSLHPVDMTSTVKVLPKRKRKRKRTRT